jgi:hypothetical protein
MIAVYSLEERPLGPRNLVPEGEKLGQLLGEHY